MDISGKVEERNGKIGKKFLPIGSVVLLENGEKKAMITRVLPNFPKRWKGCYV